MSESVSTIVDAFNDAIDIAVVGLGLGEVMNMDMQHVQQHHITQLAELNRKRITDGAGGHQDHDAGADLREAIRYEKLCVSLSGPDADKIDLPEHAIVFMNERDLVDHVLQVNAWLTAIFNKYLACAIGDIKATKCDKDEDERPVDPEDTWSAGNNDKYLEAMDAIELKLAGPEAACTELAIMASLPDLSDLPDSPITDLAVSLVDHIQAHTLDILEIRADNGRRVLTKGDVTASKFLKYLMQTPDFVRVAFAMLVLLSSDLYGLCLLGRHKKYVSGVFKDTFTLIENLTDARSAPALLEHVFHEAKKAKKGKVLVYPDLVAYPTLGLSNAEASCSGSEVIHSDSYDAAFDATVDFENSDDCKEIFSMLLIVTVLYKQHKDVGSAKGEKAAAMIVELLTESPSAARYWFIDSPTIPKESFDHAVAALLEAWLAANADVQGQFKASYSRLDEPEQAIGVIVEEM
jgi:hypothetical protein